MSAPAAVAFNASIVNKTDKINSIRHFDFPFLFSLLTRELDVGNELTSLSFVYLLIPSFLKYQFIKEEIK